MTTAISEQAKMDGIDRLLVAGRAPDIALARAFWECRNCQQV